MAYKLGRLAPKSVAPVGDLTHYLTESLPDPPVTLVAPKLTYPMAGNDVYGDCTIAAVVHTDQATANLTSEPYTYPGDKVVEAEYFKLTGGPDTGLVERDVLNVWRSNAGLFNHQLAGFCSLNIRHTVVIKQAAWLCGAVYTGILVPEVAEQQFNEGEPWHLTHTPADDNIIGGHAVPIVGYNRTGFIVVTWGRLQQMNYGWWNKYSEEAYATITAEVKAAGALRAVDFAQLDKDLAALHSA